MSILKLRSPVSTLLRKASFAVRPSWRYMDLTCSSSEVADSFLDTTKKEHHMVFLFVEIAETGFEPATSGL